MLSLSADKRAALIQATADAAVALFEDIEYLREVAARIRTSRGELRRLSAILRRLLVEGDMQRIAAPRIGRMTLLAADNKRYFNISKKARIMFCSRNNAYVFGSDIGPFIFINFGKTDNHLEPEHRIRKNFPDLIGDIDPLKTVPPRFSNFVAQKFICYAGQWVSRGDIIKYVANSLSGVHSGAPSGNKDYLLEKIRGACVYSLEEGKLRIHILPELRKDSLPLTVNSDKLLDFDAAALDPLLVELLATTRLIVESPDIASLEAIHKKEMRHRESGSR